MEVFWYKGKKIDFEFRLSNEELHITHFISKNKRTFYYYLPNNALTQKNLPVDIASENITNI